MDTPVEVELNSSKKPVPKEHSDIGTVVTPDNKVS